VTQSGLDLKTEDRANRHPGFFAIGDFPMMEQQVRTFYEKGPGKMNPFTVPRVSATWRGEYFHGVWAAGTGLRDTSACTRQSCHCHAWMILKLGLADVAIAVY